MFDASVYCDKVQEEKKNEFMRLLNFLGAKTVNIDDLSSEATAVAKKVGVKVGIDPVMTAGAGAEHSANAAATAKFKVKIVTKKNGRTHRVSSSKCHGKGEMQKA